MIDSGQAQVIANAINSLANILAKPQHENWRQAQSMDRVAEDLKRISEELVMVYEQEDRR